MLNGRMHLLARRTLPHPRHSHIQVSSVVPTFLSRFLRSGEATCTHDVDHFVVHPGSGYDPCGLAAKLPLGPAQYSQACKCKLQQSARSAHLHTICASKCASFHGDACDSTQDAVQNTCDAHDLEDLGTRSQAPLQIRARCEGQEKSDQLLHQIVSVFKSCKQLSPARVKALKSTSAERLAAVLKVLKEFLGSSEKACQVLTANPSILYQQSELLRQKLTVLTHFGIKEAIVRKLCTNSGVLSWKLESLHETLILLEEVNPSARARNRILSTHRLSILHGSGISMLNALDFFKGLGMDEKELLLSLQRQPSFFFLSVESLIEKYTFFRQLGLTANEFTKVTCAGLPPLAIGTYQARIKFLKDQGFSNSDVHQLILGQPSILGLRYDCLKRKLDCLLCEHNYDIADIVKCPTCLSLSLQDRLIPRLTAIRERGLFKVYSLSTILACKDVVFQKLVRRKGQ